VTNPFAQQRIVRVPVSALGAFKVAEDDSPHPEDRVFLGYNFFDHLQGPGASAGLNFVTTNTVGIPGTKLVQTTVTQTVLPGVPPLDLNREVFGFEKAFFDGYASIELRLPMLQQQVVNGYTPNDIGDLTVIGKLALWQDQSTGNIVSGGLALTTPTGPGLNTIAGNINSVLFQPFAGYVWNFDRFFLQAFHSVVVPTDSRDVILLFNDVSLNYWIYRGYGDQIISAIVPALECHVTTPLNHRSATDPLVVPDLVVLTGGMHMLLFQHALLTAGVATPITGPRPFSVEAIAQFNWQF
jgi:hypothetical protein